MADEFAWPLRLNPSGFFATVTQGSQSEVEQSVLILLATNPGDREDVPDLGVPEADPGPVDVAVVQAAVNLYEPRAVTTLTAGSNGTIFVDVVLLEV